MLSNFLRKMGSCTSKPVDELWVHFWIWHWLMLLLETFKIVFFVFGCSYCQKLIYLALLLFLLVFNVHNFIFRMINMYIYTHDMYAHMYICQHKWIFNWSNYQFTQVWIIQGAYVKRVNQQIMTNKSRNQYKFSVYFFRILKEH